MLASNLGSRSALGPVLLMLRRAALLLTLTGCLAVPSLAHASGSAVIRDCEQNGQLTGHYSQGDLNSALHSLPADLKEYSNCEEDIEQAEAAAASHPVTRHHSPTGTDPSSGAAGGGTGGTGGSGSGSGGAGSTSSGITQPRAHTAGKAPSTSNLPADTKALQQAQRGSALGSAVAGATVRPGDASSGGGASLPTPLLIVIVLLGAGALASLVVAGRRRRQQRSPRVGRVLARDRT